MCKDFKTSFKTVDCSIEECLSGLDANDKVAVLNHASYKAPAQKYMDGSTGREESLCDSSFPYNVLSSEQLSDYFKENSKRLNRGLYLDRGLYTPDDIFNIFGEKHLLNVISVTAPNNGFQYKKFTNEENEIALKSRLEFILNIAAIENIETLVLGAFGCSVYKQSAEKVSKIFFDLLTTKYSGFFKKVIVQVNNESHYKAFKLFFN